MAALALLLGGCGAGERPDQPKRPKRPLGPGQVIKNAPGLKSASVRGRAYPVGTTQLVLAGPEQSIFAFADTAVVGGVRRPGQTVLVSGPIRRLTRAQATELADEVARLNAGRRPPEVVRARRNVGAPYVQVERIGAAPAAGMR